VEKKEKKTKPRGFDAWDIESCHGDKIPQKKTVLKIRFYEV